MDNEDYTVLHIITCLRSEFFVWLLNRKLELRLESVIQLWVEIMSESTV